ncbi:MAG: alpha-glucuronidase family glycosyl hydrolase [Vicinamibacteria bacterium]
MVLVPYGAKAETGYDLWLRHPRVGDDAGRSSLARVATEITVEGSDRTLVLAGAELARGLRGLLGTEVRVLRQGSRDGALVLGTPTSSSAVRALNWSEELRGLGPDGFVIRSAHVGGRRATVIASQGATGVLYGAFHYLRLAGTGARLDTLQVRERPRIALRMLDHWDNLDGSIERGYAGRSLWKWDELPERVDPRVVDYARANASLGINATVLNNVNAKADSLTAPYLKKAAAIADALRPYGIRVFLSANFAAPRIIGGLEKSDPLDPAVARFWKDKADEIYKVIPDFGGFLVKANSEGQPGPQDYRRTHADGANVLADALAPHGGIVMWRAFVYDAEVDPDRVKRAYLEFVPLDGKFRDNVFVQVKNGPLDFMPREPFHPMFGAMPQTPLLAELQVTQEYLGHSNHLAYLAPMWKEFLDADTYAKGPGSTVAKVVDGTLHGYARTGIAGVANTGDDRNWTGHDLAQANWYAFGRLAWDPSLTPEAIAEEWVRLTFTRDPAAVAALSAMLMGSRESFVRYTMPLGLHHLIGGDHYAPMPENADPRRLDWTATYYHRADKDAIGFDRTKSGSDAVGQYRSPLREQWGDPKTVPPALLLWFHRVPWDTKLASGRTVWEEIVADYELGAREAAELERQWGALRGAVDPERHEAVRARLSRQASDAAAWRDHCVGYFAGINGRPAKPAP